MTNETRSPSEIVEAFFHAIEEERWADAADLVDPAEVARLHAEWAAAMRGGRRSTTVDIMGRSAVGGTGEPSPAPRKVTISFSHQPLTPVPGSPGVSDPEELTRLEPKEAVASMLASRYGEVARTEESASGTASDRPPAGRHIRVVLGEVIELDTLAHVVYRTLLQHEGGLSAPEPVALISLRSTPDGWRIQSIGSPAPGRVWRGFPVIPLQSWFLKRRRKER